MSAIEGDTALQSTVLEDLASAVHHRDWLVSLSLPNLGKRVLEIGSGTGDYAADWAAHGVAITASEADPHRLAQLRSRFAGDARIDVHELHVPIDVDEDYDAVLAYNVLEHIPDDVEALRGFRRLVRPGGRVVLVVPAFQLAMSDFDRAIGHQRRYRAATLSAALTAAGLRVEQLRYVNAPGLLAWLVGMRLLGMRPSAGPLLRIWDGLVIPLVRRVESRWSPPFGQSLFAVATRPAG